jgi:probable F420-dependent oxidoreductase
MSRESGMEFGMLLPMQLGRDAPAVVRDFAQRVEGHGYDSLWVGDHVAIAREGKSQYPYNPGIPETESSPKRQPDSEGWGLPDPLGILHYVAACTERVKLGVSVLILPMRNPVITAHGVATLDVLSGGRAIVGIGVGWNREEFTTLAATFEARGARTDEYLEVMRRLWTLDDPTFTGSSYEVPSVIFGPRPTQQPHPPYWIGGNYEPALRRTVRFGAAWHFAFLDAEAVKPKVARLRALAEQAGRDPASVAVTGLRPDLIYQSTDDARREIEALAAAGVSHLIVGIPGESTAFERELDRFARDVIGHA